MNKGRRDGWMEKIDRSIDRGREGGREGGKGQSNHRCLHLLRPVLGVCELIRRDIMAKHAMLLMMDDKEEVYEG